MAFKDLARSLVVAPRALALLTRAVVEVALRRHCMGNAAGAGGPALPPVPPGLARRATSGIVSYFCPHTLRAFLTY